MSVNDKQVKQIAQMLTDDPDILNEMGMGRPSNDTYTAEQVPLAPGLFGTVDYAYLVSHTPKRPGFPSSEILDAKVENISGPGGETLNNPEYIQAAEKWFWENVPHLLEKQAQPTEMADEPTPEEMRADYAERYPNPNRF